MTKTVPESKFQEWEGLDRIQIIVHKMRCIYREINKDDFGIDGEIEIVVPKSDGQGFETSGSVIKFQAKSGRSYIKSDKPENFRVPVKKDDLLLWYRSNVPTLFIVYHPVDDCLYWKEVKWYIKQTKNVWQAPYHILFDKAKDVFSENSFNKMVPIADVIQPKVSWTKQEKLFTNLLVVDELPAIWSSPTNVEDEDDIYFSSSIELPPFFIFDHRLYSCVDLADPDSPLKSWINTNDNYKENNVNLWKSPDLKRGYVNVLNQLLRSHLEQLNINFLEFYKRYYFVREDSKSTEFKHNWYNVRTNRRAPERITAKKYHYGKDEFWRHMAASLNFKQIGENWYLQIIPRYYFTYDGILQYDSSKVGPLTTKIKAKEINYSVLNHVLFWTDVLSWLDQKPDSTREIVIRFSGRNMMHIKRTPCFGISPFSIPADPAVYKEIKPSRQMSLIDWEESADWEGEEENEN